jgi:hypothetical protein
MFIDQSKPDIHSDVQASLDKDHSKLNILSFLRSNLPEINNKLIGIPEVNLSDFKEDDVTREIVNLLNDKLRESSDYLFRFESKSGPDILIFVSPYQPCSKHILVVEAKRLPPTNSHDYVKTGIGRFKTEEHGADDDTAAMLGYVQKNDFDYWYRKINEWIDVLIGDSSQVPSWIAQDRLSKCQSSSFTEYKSIHSRKTKKPIVLFHFWLNFYNN